VARPVIRALGRSCSMMQFKYVPHYTGTKNNLCAASRYRHEIERAAMGRIFSRSDLMRKIHDTSIRAVALYRQRCSRYRQGGRPEDHSIARCQRWGPRGAVGPRLGFQAPPDTEKWWPWLNRTASDPVDDGGNRASVGPAKTIEDISQPWCNAVRTDERC